MAPLSRPQPVGRLGNSYSSAYTHDKHLTIRAVSMRSRVTRRQFIGGTAATIGLMRWSGTGRLDAQAPSNDPRDLGLINGRIHTMDRTSRVVSQVLIRNGRIAAAGNNIVRRGGGLAVVDLKGRTVIPGIIDAHNHIVLV